MYVAFLLLMVIKFSVNHVTENEKYIKNLPGLLIFEADKDLFCIDVKDVQSIIKIDGIRYKITHSPDMYPFIYFSDMEFFLFDTRQITEKTPSSETLGKKVILCTFFNKRIGLIADDVIEFLSLDSIFIQKHVDIIEADTYKYIKWRLEYQDRIIFYPEYEKIAKEFSIQGVYHPNFS
jgi:chemotaxis signal transduction protein